MPTTYTPSRALTYTRNVSSPKSLMDLPEELIANILLLLVSIPARCWVHPVLRSCFPSCRRQFFDRTALMRVNKALRRIALSYSLLWTDVSSAQLPTVQAVETTLQRSKRHPLRYSQPEERNAEETRALFKVVFSQSYRLQALDLFVNIDPGITKEELQRFFDVPMPLLRSLKIWVEYSGWRDGSEMRFILKHDTPSLKHIELMGLSLGRSLALAQVTSFCLYHQAIDWLVEDIVDLLRGLPRLQTLWIDKAPHLDGPVQHVDLPLLRNLDIRAVEGTFEHFCEQLFINAPQLRHFRLICSDPHDDEDEGMGPIDFFSESHLVAQIMGLPHQVPHCYDMTISVVGMTITSISLLIRPSESSTENVEPQLFQYADIRMDFVKACDMLDIHPLQSLIIKNDMKNVTAVPRMLAKSGKPEILMPVWIGYLGDSTTLTHIEFQVAEHFHSFVAHCCDSGRPLFPALQAVLVGPITNATRDSAYSSLESLLKERKERGLPIEVVIASGLDGGHIVLSSSPTIDQVEAEPIHELPSAWKTTDHHEFEELWGIPETLVPVRLISISPWITTPV
ncbi:hypothetical protein ONZ45_g18722 [Pleurotus djamor]|nr:hypothetical protein ONZ45_g18722 [Pleurotus djamor]